MLTEEENDQELTFPDWLLLSVCSYALQLFAFLTGYWWGHHWYWGFVGMGIARIGFLPIFWEPPQWSEDDMMEDDDDAIS